MHTIPKLDVALNVRGRLIRKHSCIIKCHLIQYDNVTTWYTMKYFMFEVTDYVERTKVTLPWLLPYLSQKQMQQTSLMVIESIL